jgi:hypothetical protein
MPRVQAHAADLVIVLLDHLHAHVRENKGHSSGPTLVARGRIAFAAQRDFACSLHDLGRRGLQDRIDSDGQRCQRWQQLSPKAQLKRSRAMKIPNMKARLADLGATVLPGLPADFGELFLAETEKWGKVDKLAGLAAE